MPSGQSPRDFISKLKSGSLQPPVVLIGMVKESENSETSLMFSPGNCENWIELPENAISEIRTLSMSPCKDHEHPRVRIELTQTNDPLSSALASVLMHVTSSKRHGATKVPMEQHRPIAFPRAFRSHARVRPRFGRQYFIMSAADDCSGDYPECVGDADNCENGCACCEEGGGACFCSDCCIS